MKKNILTLLGIIFISSNLSAQCTIPESDFENWGKDTIVSMLGNDIIIESPQEWFPIFGSLIAFFGDKKLGIIQSTDAISGNSSVQFVADTANFATIFYGGDMWTKFACNNNPTNLNGYFKSQGLNTEDTAYVMVIVTDNDVTPIDTVGQGVAFITGNKANWTSFNCTVNYKANGGDSITLGMMFLPNSGATPKSVNFDMFSFQPSSMNEITKSNSINIYPNPATSEITLTNIRKENIVKIYDVLGALQKEIKLTSSEQTISISELKKGIYFLELNDGNNKIVEKFVKE